MSFLSRFWTAAGRFAVRASPLGFLDRWLIKNHPLVWRTWIVHVAWYLGLFWLLFWVLGRYVPFTSIDPPTLATIASWNSMLLTAVAIAIALWTFAMIRHPLVGGSRTAWAMTFATIWAVLHLALSAPSAFNDALLPRIAALGDGWKFEAAEAALRPFNYGACYAGEIAGQNMSVVRESAGHFEIEIDGRQSRCHSNENVSLCPEETPACLILKHAGGDLDLNAFSERMTTIREAILIRDTGTGVRTNSTHPFNPYTFVGSLVLSLAVAALSFRGNVPARTESQRLSSELLYRVVSYMPYWMQQWDNSLLRNRPELWAMRSHVVALYSTLSTILFYIGAQILFPGLYNSDTSIIALFITGFFVIGMSAALMSSIYLRHFDLRLDSTARTGNALLFNLFPYAPVAVGTTAFMAIRPFGYSREALLSFFVSSLFFFIGAFSVCTVTFATRFFGRAQVILTFILISVGNLFAFLSNSLSDAVATYIVATWSLISLTAYFCRKISPLISRQLALVAILSTPWIGFYLGTLMIREIISLYRSIYGATLLENELYFVISGAFYSIQIIILGLLLRPLYRILVDMHVKPKPE